MKVNKLCQRLGLPKVKYNHSIFKITDDSKDCIDNTVFFAIEGSRVDGHDRIDEAIAGGAKTIVLVRKVSPKPGINYIYCESPKRLLALALNAYNGKRLKNIKFIGVIGTNGKTTTTTLIYHYLEYIHQRAMLIGSNGCYAKGFYQGHNNTTPRAVELYQYFNYAEKNHIRYIVMEVSSIAVNELRIMGIRYHALIFTNFSEDHLDYHKTMERYFMAKAIPFIRLRKQDYAILNADDSSFQPLLGFTQARVLTYGIKNGSTALANSVKTHASGLEFNVGTRHITSNLIGGFNVYNILPLFCICRAFGLNSELLPKFLKEFKQVSGRMNLVDIPLKHIIIDYAHTEQAIKNAILETEKITSGRVYVVVGCGGNREREKRSKIGRLLTELNCIPIITSDNPRFENPKDIIADILSGTEKEVTVIEDRRAAILYALDQLTGTDYLLILGKGCEDYMDIAGHKVKYSDLQVVEEWKRDNP